MSVLSLTLVAPVEGWRCITAAQARLALLGDRDAPRGVLVSSPDGRRLLIPVANIAALELGPDEPAPAPQTVPERKGARR